jgi:hypothetical protein
MGENCMKVDVDSVDTKKPRDYNLDLIKAICISLVLIWHLEPIDISIPNITAYSANIIFKEAQIALYFQLTLTAVPAFLITSQYLYIQKLDEHGFPYFFKRLVHLFLITLFWISCQSAFYYIFVVAKSQDPSTGFLPSSGMGWLGYFLSGGPSLPIVGGSVFYYLGVLIILTTLSTLFVWGCKWKWFEISVGLFIIISSLVYFQIQGTSGNYIGSSNIRNFIIYTPVAYFLCKYGHRIKLTLPVLLWTACLFFSYEDLILRLAGMPMNVYGRVSIAFGATALVCSFINQNNPKEVKLITFLSTYSLGIYALHKYFEYFFTLQLMPVFILFNIRKKIPVGEMRINFQVLSIAIPTILLTLVSVYILGKTPLKRFVK